MRLPVDPQRCWEFGKSTVEQSLDMWPWAKKGEEESVPGPGRFARDFFASAKELVLAPRDRASQKFYRDMDACAEKLEDEMSERDWQRVSTEAREAMLVFGGLQRDSVERVIGELDHSLRELVGVLDESMAASGDLADQTSRSTGRLAAASESASLEEMRRAVSEEVGDLVKSIRQYRESSQQVHATYQTELSRMESRLLEAQEAARKDSLTHLPNRVAHEFYLTMIIKKAEEGGQFSLAIMDLDGFKAINDELGHKAGDAALLDFGNRIQKYLGGSCFVSRLGGDEFAVVATMSAEKLEPKLELFREKLGSEPMKFEGAKVGYSVSYGVVPVEGNLRYSELMSEADDRMYRFKRKSKRRAA